MSWGFTRVVRQVNRHDSDIVKVKGKRKRKSAQSAKCVGLVSQPVNNFDPNKGIRKFLKVRRQIPANL